MREVGIRSSFHSSTSTSSSSSSSTSASSASSSASPLLAGSSVGSGGSFERHKDVLPLHHHNPHADCCTNRLNALVQFLMPWLDGRMGSLFYCLLNVAVIYLFVLKKCPEIVTRLYTQEFKEQYRFDYWMHMVAFMAYIFCLLFVIAIGVWAIAHVIVRIARHFFPCIASHADLVAAFLLVPSITIMDVVLALESVLLADMGVHLVDMNLVEAMGLKQVLNRQKELGAGLDPDHLPYVRIGIVVLLTLQCSLVIISQIIAARLTVKLASRGIAVTFAFFVMPCFAVFLLHPVVLQLRQEEFRTALPLFFYQYTVVETHARYALFKSSADLSRLPDGAGYPVNALDWPQHRNELMEPDPLVDRTYPKINNRKNVIYITQERWRYDEWADPENSRETMDYINNKNFNCMYSNKTIANGHVTEMAMFALYYGAHGYLRHQFLMNHIPSFPLETLRHNGYELAVITASTYWVFPNQHIQQMFAPNFFDCQDNNEILYHRTIDFLEARKKDKKNFFLHLHMHYSNGTKEEAHSKVLQDRWRAKIMQTLRDYNVIDDNSIFILSSDHGNMNGEHNEEGHGQPESSWWNEKALLPMWICFPGDSGQKFAADHQRTIDLASHVDVVPTWMEYLQPSPNIPIKAYSDGMSLLMPKGTDRTSDRFVYMTPRYFPQKNKVLALADRNMKFWYRVKGVNSDGMMDILPMKITDWQDNDICDIMDLTASFSKLRKSGSNSGLSCPYVEKVDQGLRHWESTAVFYHFQSQEPPEA